MGRSRNPPPFQALATDEQTVGAALKIPQAFITDEMLDGLLAGLTHTTSPLKDAVENLLLKRRGRDRLLAIQRTLWDNTIDQRDILERTSALVDLPQRYADLEAYSGELIDEYRDILFRLMTMG